MDFKEIEKKWQKKWKKAKVFEANPSNQEKFFVNVPYPYVNGYGHLGHMFTFLRGDIIARFKRMQGYNVLFTQGFHVTGQPIVAAAKRINEKEKLQIEILKDMSFSEEEIGRFSDPLEWVKFFPEKWIDDFKNLGFSIDWRRSFITTYLNKPYDCFIRWQFKKLKEKGYIKKGEHPVVYCYKCNFPIGDHDRVKGEGIVPEETILLKFKLKGGDEIIPVMTYRPETIYGVTNLWINPSGIYVKAKVKKNFEELWIISKDSLKDLKNQNFEIEKIENIEGKELVKKEVINLVNNKKISILPSKFVDPKVGTGVVMSVPAHAPFDYAAIKELRENEELRKLYNLDKRDLEFEFVSLIELKGYSRFPAVDIVDNLRIKSTQEREKLEKATEEIYKKEFHSGILKIDFLKGKRVCEVKKELIEKFVEKGIGVRYYILPERVICRCLKEGKIKIVKDQWFLNYSNKEWKKKAHNCIEKMRFYPESIREKFHYTIDWLNDWACTRDKKTSLGTILPFDQSQVIESLSDSTIYMAYYTISHYLQGGKLKNNKVLKDNFFDYIFLGIGDKEKVAKENGFSNEELEKIRKEFLYWYFKGFQIRNSGKDLIQNHLTFCIFNHVAIFPGEYWPSGFSLNGHVLLNGEKMSKSKGNVIFMKDAIKNYPIDVLRFLVAYSGDSGLDDANIELKESKSIEKKLKNFYQFAVSNYNKGNNKLRRIDSWLESVLNRIIKDVEREYENLNTKSILQQGFFELQNFFKWYRKRSIEFNKEVVNKFIETQLKILAPIVPFICEELWEKLGNKGFISLEKWPEYDESKIDLKMEANEERGHQTISDIEAVIKLSKIEEPKELLLFVAEKWKYDFLKELKEVLKKTRDIKMIMKEVVVKEHSREIAKIVPRLVKDPSKIPSIVTDQDSEYKSLTDLIDFLRKEFRIDKIVVKRAEDSKEAKAKQAMPGKPAILLK